MPAAESARLGWKLLQRTKPPPAASVPGMTEIERIVTHPGGAHKDDLLATCVLIARHGCAVARRDPTDAELADASVAIVDVGGSHDASLSNFDHHHFPRDHAPTCALSLVLDSIGLYEDAQQFCEWLEPAEWFDSRGPNKTAEWLGVPRRAIGQLNSPIDITLLRRFARHGDVARCAIRKAVLDCHGARARCRAEREAIRSNLEHFNLIRRTRGGVPLCRHSRKETRA